MLLCRALLQVLLRLFPQQVFRNIALQCLTEVSAPLPPLLLWRGSARAGGAAAMAAAVLCLYSSNPWNLHAPFAPCPGAHPQIAALQVGPEYNPHFANLYTFFIAQLAALMPPGTNIPEAYARGSDEDQAFVQNLALFLTAFFRAHLGWVWVQLGQWGSGLWLWACACQAAAEASCGRLEAPCLRTSPQASACQP
jgi:hypothetical protein